MRNFWLISVLITAILSVCPCYCKGENANYGNAVLQSVSDVCDVGEVVIKCNIKNFPPVIGKDICVKIDGVKTLDDANDFTRKEIKTFLFKTLKGSKVVVLKNLQRGKSFCIIADVYCDGKNLAQQLMEKGYAEKAERDSVEKIETEKADNDNVFLGSKNSKVFHKKGCHWTHNISDENRVEYKSRQDAISQDKRPCKACKP